MKARALVISNISWSFVWQRHQSVATLLAGEYETGFVELAGTRSPRLADVGRLWRHLRAEASQAAAGCPVWLARPLVLPASNVLFKAINARLVSRWLARDARLLDFFDIVVCYPQTRTALQLLEQLRFGRLIYDCTDDWLEVAGIPRSLVDDEKELMQRADLTLVPSRTLLERKAASARRCVQLPHGAWLERFAVDDKPPGGGVTCLYYGHILEQHLDFAAIERLAHERPRWRIILVGPVKTMHRFPRNVELPGQTAHEALVDWVRQADVILLPYVSNGYTAAVMPAKTYEVLATGRPVVATPLPELREKFAAHMVFAAEPSAWTAAIESALAGDSAAKRQGRRSAAAAHSWTARFATLKSLLADLPEREVAS